MKFTAIIFIILLTLASSDNVSASEISVDISNSSTVVNNVNVKSNSDSSNSVSDVTIETNGDIKSFHAEGNQKIDWQSDDGKSQVHIETGNTSNNVKVDQNISSNETIQFTSNSNQATQETVSKKFEEFTEVSSNSDDGDLFDFVKNTLESFNEMTYKFFDNLFG